MLSYYLEISLIHLKCLDDYQYPNSIRGSTFVMVEPKRNGTMGRPHVNKGRIFFETVNDFLGECSLHGFKYFPKSRWFVKVFWVRTNLLWTKWLTCYFSLSHKLFCFQGIALVCCLSYAFSMCYIAVDRWTARPVTTSIDNTAAPVKDLSYPSVTTCRAMPY